MVRLFLAIAALAVFAGCAAPSTTRSGSTPTASGSGIQTQDVYMHGMKGSNNRPPP